MMNIIFLIKEYLKSKNIQEFINDRFFDTNRLIIPQTKDENGNYDYTKWMKIVSQDGKTFFYWNEPIPTIKSVIYDYCWDDIRKDDIVLDIGSCIGGYALQICHNVKHVYAVEPVYDEFIRKNIELTNSLNNSIKNVDVVRCVLGSKKGNVDIIIQGKEINVESHTLSELIQMCGGHVDILKCDCEGGEWSIRPEELKDIRRIEMEIHVGSSYRSYGGTDRTKNVINLEFTDKNKKIIDYIDILVSIGFKCIYNKNDKNTVIVHAFKEENIK